MTEVQDPLVPVGDDAQLLADELACACGTLSEIMTMWRRARPFRPDLRPGRLTCLQDAARQLAADVSPVPSVTLARSMARRLSMLEEGVASAREMAAEPGIPQVGDDRLWESLLLALHSARTRLAVPMPDADRASRPAAG